MSSRMWTRRNLPILQVLIPPPSDTIEKSKSRGFQTDTQEDKDCIIYYEGSTVCTETCYVGNITIPLPLPIHYISL